MPMFSDLARDARLDALTFLRTLITDPASLADDDDENATLDLDTLHHRRLAATAILRFQVDEADDFEYDDGDDDTDTTDTDTDTDADADADADANSDAEHPDDNEDTNPDVDDAEYNDENDDDDETDNDAPDSPPAAPPGPGGANERSHGWSSRQRAQPVERIVIDSSRPGGADDAHTTDVHAFSLAPPHTPAASHIP